MGLGHPHCYARRRTDGYGIFPCYPNGEPPYFRRRGDDGSDADVDIDLSDDDPDDWIERWLTLPVVSSYAASEEPQRINWADYNYPNHDYKDADKKAAFMRSVVFALATWLMSDGCGYGTGSNQRKVPTAILHPTLNTVPDNQRINWWALKRYFRKKRSLRNTARRALMY